ncbi:hypothetical protein T08_14614 [Trichinella sp. T8]|nr:hypothetical protein T08_14614 [Trichinella sp. T8]
MTSHSIKSTSKSKIFQSSIACNLNLKLFHFKILKLSLIRKNHSRGTVVQNSIEEEMFLSNGNRFKYFAIACHLELVIIKCVINFFHLSGACFVVVLGLADAGLPACVFIRFGSAISVLLCSFRLLLHVRNYCQLNSLFRLFCFFGLIDAHQAERIWLCAVREPLFNISLSLSLSLNGTAFDRCLLVGFATSFLSSPSSQPVS